MRKKTINPNMFQPVKGFARFRLSPAERAKGRVMRAPDGHEGGDGGSDGGTGDAGGGAADAGAGGADGGAGAAPADAGANGQGDGAQAGGADDGGKDGAGGGDGGAGGADGEGSILSDAGRGDADDKPGGDGDGGADGARLTFGEGEAAADILGAPETYELVVPPDLAEAGVAFDAEAFKLVEPVMRDLNLSQPAAQALVNAYAKDVLPLIASRGQNAAETMGADMRRQWATDAEAEFNGKDGNPTLVEAKGYARQAFIASGIKADSPFLTMLEESGLGNHPDMVRFVSWVGRNVGEAKVDPNPGAGGAPVSMADKIYGKPDPA